MFGPRRWSSDWLLGRQGPVWLEEDLKWVGEHDFVILLFGRNTNNNNNNNNITVRAQVGTKTWSHVAAVTDLTINHNHTKLQKGGLMQVFRVRIQKEDLNWTKFARLVVWLLLYIMSAWTERKQLLHWNFIWRSFMQASAITQRPMVPPCVVCVYNYTEADICSRSSLCMSLYTHLWHSLDNINSWLSLKI